MHYYPTRDSFIKINETSGTIQNASKFSTIEVSNATTKGSGILLKPMEKIIFSNQTVYVRSVDGEGADVVAVPFYAVNAIASGSSSGSSGSSSESGSGQVATTADVESVLDDIFG